MEIHRLALPGGGGEPVERDQIDDRYKWQLDKIFADWDAWESCFGEIEGSLEGLARLRGTLAESGPGLVKAIEAIHDTQRKLEKGFVYAGMKSDEDTRVGENTARKGRISSLAVRFNEAVSWFESELLEITDERLTSMNAEEPGLELYAHFFHNIHRGRKHTLDAQREALLASAGLMARGAGQVFNAFDNADLELGTITDEDGKPAALTKGRFYKYMKSSERRVREEAYIKFLDAYGGMKNTLAANMDANVKNHVFFASARNHEGTLEAALHPDGVPPEVFHSLIGTVSENLDTIHRYTALKKKVLALDPLKEFDLSVPLFQRGEFKFDYDEACPMLLKAFAPLGSDYVKTVGQGIEGGWIDVHESAGKRSGGYSNGVYDTPPYILLNWADQLGDTFTLAHELGHSMHSCSSTGTTRSSPPRWLRPSTNCWSWTTC
jgi:oligoendopeptidase F